MHPSRGAAASPSPGRLVLLAALLALPACGTVEPTQPDGGDPGAPDAAVADAPPIDETPRPVLVFADARHDFGAATVGQRTVALATRIISQGTAAAPPIEVAIQGDSAADFTVDAAACTSVALGIGSDCDLTVHFQPSAAGPRVATVVVSHGGTVAASLELGGRGLAPGALEISPPIHEFAPVLIDERSAAQPFTITNRGDVSLPKPTLSLEPSAGYTLDAGTCTADLAGGASCTASLVFSPTRSGAATTTLLATAGESQTASSVSGSGAGELIITRSGAGAGRITGEGLDCGETCRVIVATSTATIDAAATAGSRFKAWTGATCSGTRCTVPIARTQTVDARFVREFTLVAEKLNMGQGSITQVLDDGTVVPGGFRCDVDRQKCELAYEEGSSVLLAQGAASGWAYTGWMGCDSTPRGKCRVLMSRARNVIVTFVRTP